MSEDSIQAGSSGAVPSPRQISQEEFLLRDFKAYAEKGAAAAYRAGLSSATAICDRVAAEYSKNNAHDRTCAAVAISCGNAIWNFHKQCQGDRPNEDAAKDSA